MKQWYFTYKGKQYPTGTVILLKGIGSPQPQEAVFVCYETNNGRYTYKKIGNMCGKYIVPTTDFLNCFVGVVEGKTAPDYIQHEYGHWHQRNKKLTITEEIDQIEGMFGAWTMYIVAMLASLVCKEWYFGWMLSSLIFFTYRYGKLNERRDK
jgi:hypothetical protein